MNFLQHYLPGQPQESNGQYSNGIQTNLIVDRENMDIALGIDLERAKCMWLRCKKISWE